MADQKINEARVFLFESKDKYEPVTDFGTRFDILMRLMADFAAKVLVDRDLRIKYLEDMILKANACLSKNPSTDQVTEATEILNEAELTIPGCNGLEQAKRPEGEG